MMAAQVRKKAVGGKGTGPEESPALNSALNVLEMVSSDIAVPKNVRKEAQDIINRLNNKSRPLQVRLNSIMQLLDDMSNDPNIPLHTRTQLWQIASLLEAAGKR